MTRQTPPAAGLQLDRPRITKPQFRQHSYPVPPDPTPRCNKNL